MLAFMSISVLRNTTEKKENTEATEFVKIESYLKQSKLSLSKKHYRETCMLKTDYMIKCRQKSNANKEKECIHKKILAYRVLDSSLSIATCKESLQSLETSVQCSATVKKAKTLLRCFKVKQSNILILLLFFVSSYPKYLHGSSYHIQETHLTTTYPKKLKGKKCRERNI